MKFETTPAFDADYRKLKAEHRKAFRDIVKAKFVPACDAHAADPGAPWPRSLRVKPVQAAPGVLEMTWSFASPDGRATFELVTVDAELRCRWRRVGSETTTSSNPLRSRAGRLPSLSGHEPPAQAAIRHGDETPSAAVTPKEQNDHCQFSSDLKHSHLI